MSMTRKDYELIARAIGKARAYPDKVSRMHAIDIIAALQFAFEKDNPKFNADRFIDEIYIAEANELNAKGTLR